MPKYPKSKPPVPFDGVSHTRYDQGYFFNKVVFTILGDRDLWICFYDTCKPKQHRNDFFVDSFRSYAAFEVIQNINTFNARAGVKTNGEWGRHFEDGVLEIWHKLELPFYGASRMTRTASDWLG